MTQVHIDLEQPGPSGPEAVRVGMVWTPTMPHREGNAIILPESFGRIIFGQATYDVEPTDLPHWVWHVRYSVNGGTYDEWVIVPDSPTTVEWADLTRVDPATLDPAASPEAAWWRALAEVSAPSDEVISAAVAAWLVDNPVGLPEEGADGQVMTVVSGAWASAPAPVGGGGGGDGEPGAAGPPNVLSIGTITTGAPGTSASATITGSSPTQVLSLTIPKGDPGAAGAQGSPGATGPAVNLTVGTITTGAPGAAATVTITGTAPNQSLSMTLPKGDTGPTGPTGAAGPANTLSIGTVTTAAAGSSASATITGTAPTQTLNLTIPRGAAGADGTFDSSTAMLLAGSQTATGAKTFSAATVFGSTIAVTGVATFTVAPAVPDNAFSIAKVNGLAAALSAAGSGGVYWHTYDYAEEEWPTLPSSAPAGTKIRISVGPSQPTVPDWAFVPDLYFLGIA